MAEAIEMAGLALNEPRPSEPVDNALLEAIADCEDDRYINSTLCRLCRNVCIGEYHHANNRGTELADVMKHPEIVEGQNISLWRYSDLEAWGWTLEENITSFEHIRGTVSILIPSRLTKGMSC